MAIDTSLRRHTGLFPVLWILLLSCAGVTTPAYSQDLNSLTPEQIDAIQSQLRKQKGNEEFTSPVDQVRARAPQAPGSDKRSGTPETRSSISEAKFRTPETEFRTPETAFQTPETTSGPPQTPSRLEIDYGERTGKEVRQFGYDLFESGTMTDASFFGAVSESYRLGIGDELVVTLLGQTSRTIDTRVDREGRVVMPGFPPIAAAGRTFGEFRAELKARIAASMIGTEVFVSVGAVRLIRVVVAGEVAEPGIHQLTGLSNLLDALYKAGGVKKTGSLRRIALQRGNERRDVDLYRLLLDGRFKTADALMEGDRIIVPPIGPTAEVGGEVKRPGIFELNPGDSPTMLTELIDWAGGPLRAQGSRVSRMALDRAGQDVLSEPEHVATTAGHDGDILLVQSGASKVLDSVTLTGHVRAPGLRSLAAAPTLSVLIGGLAQLKEDPYLSFAILSRVDRATGARVLSAINLARVFAGATSVELQADDIVAVLGMDDIRFLDSTELQRVINGTDPSGAACSGLRNLAVIVSGGRGNRYANALRHMVSQPAQETKYEVPCPEVYDTIPDALPFTLENAMALSGEVRTPGVFPVGPGTSVAELLPYAGGMTRVADLGNAELTRYSLGPRSAREEVERSRLDLRAAGALDTEIRPGEVLRINPISSERDDGPVLLTGEFVLPGTYDITRGERLSQVIARAGGMTGQAYPYGAVFTRERIRRQEKENFDRYIRDLESAIVTAQARTRQGSASAVTALQDLVTLLRETAAVGRMVVEADPTVLQVRPDLDVILEPGDRIHIPKRPSFVTIAGEVLNPGAVSFQSGLDAKDYIHTAGGFTRVADDGRVFVVLPNGSARPLAVSFWNYRSKAIPPGSTIIVPRDPLPFDLMTATRDMVSIFSDVAITAAALNSLKTP